MKKELKTKEQLEVMIDSAEWLGTHTPDKHAREEYQLKETTYRQDFYVTTGYWYRGNHGTN